MGRTVEELTATLSHGELQEWIAYYGFEPFGSPVEDQRARVSNQLFFDVNYEGEPPSTILFERDTEEADRIRAETKRQVELAQLRDFFERRIEQPPQ